MNLPLRHLGNFQRNHPFFLILLLLCCSPFVLQIQSNFPLSLISLLVGICNSFPFHSLNFPHFCSFRGDGSSHFSKFTTTRFLYQFSTVLVVHVFYHTTWYYIWKFDFHFFYQLLFYTISRQNTIITKV